MAVPRGEAALQPWLAAELKAFCDSCRESSGKPYILGCLDCLFCLAWMGWILSHAKTTPQSIPAVRFHGMTTGT